MRRRLYLLALGMIVAIAPAWAQQPNRIPVVGVLTGASNSDDPLFKVLLQALRDLGYADGRNIKIEFRTARGRPDRLPGLAEELVERKVDVIIVTNAPAAQALRRATSTIPIVAALFDPVAAGLITNLANPGGNITGLSSMTVELSAKRLQLLREAIPGLTRVAVLWSSGTLAESTRAKMFEEIKEAARSLLIELKFVDVRTPEEIRAAVSAAGRTHVQALYLLENPVFYTHRASLAMLASKAGLPTIYGARVFADEGGLMSYGMDYADQLRRAGGYVDKILKGAKPGDLPIEQPTKVVNLKTAKALGITIPQSILLRADEVIR